MASLVSVSAAEASDAGQRSIEHLDGILIASSSRQSDLREEPKKGDQFVDWIRSQYRAADTYDETKAVALFSRFVKNQTWQCPTMVAESFDLVRGDRRLTSGDPRMKYVSPRIERATVAPWQERAVFSRSRVLSSFHVKRFIPNSGIAGDEP